MVFLPLTVEEDLRAANEPDLTDDLCTEEAPDVLTLADRVSKELRPFFDRAYSRSPTVIVSGRE